MAKKRITDNRWSPNGRAMRQQRVAQLWVRNLSIQEIYDALARPDSASYMVNPATKLPYSYKAVERDVLELRQQYKDQSREAVSEYYAHMIATALEVQRVAWARNDLGLVLGANGELRAIIGKPTQTEVAYVNLNDVDLSVEQLEALAAGASWAQVMAMK